MTKAGATTKGPPEPGRESWRYYLNEPRGGRPSWFERMSAGTVLTTGGVAILGYAIFAGWSTSRQAAQVFGALAMVSVGVILLADGAYLRRTNPALGLIDRSRRPGESAREWSERMEQAGHRSESVPPVSPHKDRKAK